MRTESVTLLIILCGVLLIFGIVGWIVVRVEARLRQRDTGIAFGGNPGSCSSGVVGVSGGDGGAGCGS